MLKKHQVTEESGEYVQLTFLKASKVKKLLFYLCYILSLGVFYLFVQWFIRLKLLRYNSSTVGNATHVMVRNKENFEEIVPLKTIFVPLASLGYSDSLQEIKIKTFVYRFIRYYATEENFTALQFPYTLSYNKIHEILGKGIQDKSIITGRQALFGPCLVDVPMPSIWKLLVTEVIHPFFVFQIFSIILWVIELYYFYSGIIFFMSMLSLCTNLYETRRNIKCVREMALYECKVNVCRENQWSVLHSREIVPGDLIEIPENCPLPCDLVLIKGVCLVDESMLTGESQPILKDALPLSSHLVYALDKKYSLSSGTIPLTCRGGAIGVATSTGFSTAKGELVRSILFPKPNRFNFYVDSFKFVGFMGIIGITGALYYLVWYIVNAEDPIEMLLSCGDLVTTVIPPVLPLACTMSTSFAIKRLKDKKISCISPPAVNSSGRVTIICFDKTGTLTEDSMTLKGAWDINSQKIEDELDRCNPELQENMASCHSLTMLDGELLGDPQEIEIFNKIGWRYYQSDDENNRFIIEKNQTQVNVKFIYHFSPILKRMAVVTENEGRLRLHLKGAPEKISPSCINLPDDYNKQLLHLTRAGYRVLACAYKDIPEFDPKTPIEEIEKEATFLGFLVLQNQLKTETKGILKILEDANIRCYVSTGDALLTGAAVGKECEIIPEENTVYYGDIIHEEVEWRNEEGDLVSSFEDKIAAPNVSLALTGSLLEHLANNKSKLIPDIVQKGAVFGRMSPQQKVILIEQLQTSEALVAMVGDGANDCGALKAADVGLSLSDLEASIAAPFTGKKLECVLDILKEGRASLTTSFQCFKFITMYSITEFVCENFLFLNHTNYTERQFLYMDIFLILPFSVFMASTPAHTKLSNYLPPTALFSVDVLVSIWGHLILMTATQGVVFASMILSDWYEPTTGGYVGAAEPCVENTAMFYVSALIIWYMCIVFSTGPPFRKSTWRNYWFTGFAAVSLAITLYLVLIPAKWARTFMQMDYIPVSFRFILLIILGSGYIASYFYEKFGVRIGARLIRKMKPFRKTK